ncbi:putative digalactosyldiacylglycerol synthase 1, chloroplastic [Sesbania bispinosa]|nr:putative digalactosyldiacylglycerol synthase 1, chloroplastic [Sesbania bispinosa]
MAGARISASCGTAPTPSGTSPPRRRLRTRRRYSPRALRRCPPRWTSSRTCAPKLSEIPRWQPSRSRIRIDLSAIREAFESEVEDNGWNFGFLVGNRKWKRLSCKEFWGEWNGDEHRHKDWEPIRALKTRFKEFEKNSEFVGKLKSSFVCPFSC